MGNAFGGWSRKFLAKSVGRDSLRRKQLEKMPPVRV
jgi:hypothetical protein